MLLYTCQTAPSPRRVRVFFAEKGLEVPMQEVDLRGGEHFSEAFRCKNPYGTVPVLELDDGTCIGDSEAICTYFEALHPEPTLMGADARARAVIHAADRWVELDGYLAVMEAFRNKLPGFKDRALPAPTRCRRSRHWWSVAHNATETSSPIWTHDWKGRSSSPAPHSQWRISPRW
ncbi:MAG: glutathione S-transferase [Arhodomonas sp.]|nr:glutathione S-transferase [Arhodomonas sp.]